MLFSVFFLKVGRTWVLFERGVRSRVNHATCLEEAQNFFLHFFNFIPRQSGRAEGNGFAVSAEEKEAGLGGNAHVSDIAQTDDENVVEISQKKFITPDAFGDDREILISVKQHVFPDANHV